MKKLLSVISFTFILASCGNNEHDSHGHDYHEHYHHGHEHHNHGHGHDHSSFEWNIQGDNGSINIYSARHFLADEQIFRAFTETTGIGVNVIHANSGQIVARLDAEGASTVADLIIADDGAMLSNMTSRGMLSPISFTGHYWQPLSYRTRVIATTGDYNITSYTDLMDSSFYGEILLRPGNHMYNISLLAFIIHIYGFDAALEWAEAVVSNAARTPSGNDRDQLIALEAGLGSVALVNTYYLGLLQSEGLASEVSLIWPHLSHINVSGMAIPIHSSNSELAEAFIQFAMEDYAQNILVTQNNEFSIRGRSPNFFHETLDFDSLYENHINAINIMNIVGW